MTILIGFIGSIMWNISTMLWCFLAFHLCLPYLLTTRTPQPTPGRIFATGIFGVGKYKLPKQDSLKKELISIEKRIANLNKSMMDLSRFELHKIKPISHFNKQEYFGVTTNLVDEAFNDFTRNRVRSCWISHNAGAVNLVRTLTSLPMNFWMSDNIWYETGYIIWNVQHINMQSAPWVGKHLLFVVFFV